MIQTPAMDHPRRREIVRVLQERGVARLRELHRATGIPLGTLSHHVGVLTWHGVVYTEYGRASRLLWLPPHDVEWARRACRLREEGLGDVFDAVVAGGGRRFQHDVMAALPSMPRSTVQHRLARLVAVGLVRCIPQGRCLRYEVTA